MEAQKPAKPPPLAKKPVGLRASLQANSSGAYPPVAPRKSPVGPAPAVPKKPPALPQRPPVATTTPRTTPEDGNTSTADTPATNSTPRPAPRPRPVPRKRISLDKQTSEPVDGRALCLEPTLEERTSSRSMSVDSTDDSMDMRIPAPDGSSIGDSLQETKPDVTSAADGVVSSPQDVSSNNVCDNYKSDQNAQRTTNDEQKVTSSLNLSFPSGRDTGFPKSNSQTFESQDNTDFTAQTLPKSRSMKFERKPEFSPRTLPKSQSQRFHSEKKPQVRDMADSMKELISVGLKNQLSNKDRPKPPPKPKPNLKAKPILTPTGTVSKDRPSSNSSGAKPCSRSLSYEQAVSDDPNQSDENKLAASVPAVESSDDEILDNKETKKSVPTPRKGIQGVQVLPVIKFEEQKKSQDVKEVSPPEKNTETAEASCISSGDQQKLTKPPEDVDIPKVDPSANQQGSGDEIMRKDSGRKQYAVFNAPPPPPMSELEQITAQNSKMSQIPSVHEDDKNQDLKPYRKAPPPPPLPIKRGSTKKEKPRVQTELSEQSPGTKLPSPPPMLVPRKRNTDTIGRSPYKNADRALPPVPGEQPGDLSPALPPRKNPKYDSLGYLRPNPLGEMESDVYSYAAVDNLDLLVPKSPMMPPVSPDSLDVPIGTEPSLDINRNEPDTKERSDSTSSDKRESKRSSLSSLGSNIYEFIRSRANSKDQKDKRSTSMGSSVFYVDDTNSTDDLDIDIEVKVGGGARTPPQVDLQALTPSPPLGNDDDLMDTVIPLPVAPPRSRKKNKSIDLGIIGCSTDDGILDEDVPSEGAYDETYMIGGATYEEPSGLRSRHHDSSDSDSDDYIYPGLQRPLAKDTSPNNDDTPPPVPPRNKPQPQLNTQTSLPSPLSPSHQNQLLSSSSLDDENEYSEPKENEYNEPESPVSQAFDNVYAEADEVRPAGLGPPKLEEEYADAEEIKEEAKTQFGSSGDELEYCDAEELKEEVKALSGSSSGELEYCDAEEIKEEVKAQFGSSGGEIEYCDTEEVHSLVAAVGTNEDSYLLASASITNDSSQNNPDESSAEVPANRGELPSNVDLTEGITYNATDNNTIPEEDIYESFSDEGSDSEKPLNTSKTSSSAAISIQNLDSSPKCYRRAPLDTDTTSGRQSYASSVDSVFLNTSSNVFDVSVMELDNDSLQSLSDDSDGDGVDLEDGQNGSPKEEKLARKRKKAFYIAQEIMTSEKSFVDVLQLLNQDYRESLDEAKEALGQQVIPEQQLNSIFKFLPQLENFNRELLKDLQKRISNWEENPRICDIFVKVGPFLKLYTSYIRGFEAMQASFDDARKRLPEFDRATKDFEMSPRCANLALKHYMLRPIQRIPQYRLLLLDYQKQLAEDALDYEDTKSALVIVSEVAEHANHSMKFGDDFKKLWDIQNSLIGQFEVIQPGREFIKEGILQKLSRKEMQPRMFFLLSDVLLYTTPVAAGYKLNNAIPLTGIRVNLPTKEDFQNEFSIMSTQRSFTVCASTAEERADWLKTLKNVIEENRKKRSSFEIRKPSLSSIDFKPEIDQNFKLGTRAPVWVPDARVSMCMLCTAEYTVTFRRHHCRACGKVVCGFCSDYRAPLRYLKYKAARVCSKCFYVLEREIDSVDLEPLDPPAAGERLNPFSRSSIKAKFKGLRAGGSFRRSLGKGKFKRPAVLQEITANSECVEMSGYLKVWKGSKWKKRWFVLHGKALYTFRESEDAAAIESMVLLGFEVRTFSTWFEGVEPNLVFELVHKGTNPIVFRTESPASRDKWINAMREATLP